MSLSTTEPITATSTGSIAIRTPFVQPPDCKTQWKTTTVPASVVSGTTIMTPILISEPAATCYPSRWDEVTPESRLSFSPGVCPEGWVYNAMAEDGSSAASTAFCCNRFAWAVFFPLRFPPLIHPFCLREVASQMIQSLTAVIMLQRLLIFGFPWVRTRYVASS